MPLLGLSVERTDNVLYHSAQEPDRVVPANILTRDVGLMLDVPVSNSSIRLAGAARDRRYDVSSNTSGWYARVDADLIFGDGTKVTVRDDFEHAEVEAQTFLGGNAGAPASGEIAFTRQQYRQNVVAVDVDHATGDTGDLAGRYERGRVHFTGGGSSGFYNVTSDTLELRGAGALGVRSRIIWSVTGLRNELARPESPAVAGGVPEFLADRSLQRGLSLRAGWTRDLGSAGSLAIRGGAIRVAVDSSSSFRYYGVVGSVEYLRSVPDRFYASAGYYRDVFPSAFTSNALYVGGTFTVRVATPSVMRFLAGGEVSATTNDYPADASGRRDDVAYVRGWVGYRFLRALRLQVFAQHATRRSTTPLLDFRVNRFGTSLSWGF